MSSARVWLGLSLALTGCATDDGVEPGSVTLGLGCGADFAALATDCPEISDCNPVVVRATATGHAFDLGLRAAGDEPAALPEAELVLWHVGSGALFRADLAGRALAPTPAAAGVIEACVAIEFAAAPPEFGDVLFRTPWQPSISSQVLADPVPTPINLRGP